MNDLPEAPLPSSPETTRALFPGFRELDIPTSGATIRVLTGGTGPALLLLHGNPQTHVMWHKIAPALARDYSVVLTDLRGYGDSSKPEGDERHANYSFRAMAQDQIDVMRALGHQRFMLAGHDRGARTAHRLCLDYPQAVEKVALLDIAPTLTMYDDTGKEFATRYVWWFFLIQPAPFPERLIGLDARYFLEHHLTMQGKSGDIVTAQAFAEYARCFCCTSTIHAVCEDYRAAAGIDLEMDRADEAAGKKIAAPVLALWGANGTVGKLWDVLATWRTKSSGPVSGKALDGGHYLAEERPREVLAEFQTFFR